MTQAQKVFEAMMRAKGYTDFSATKGRYIANTLVPARRAMQTDTSTLESAMYP
jgi:hypothetical protein